jgi:IstB-like ATP binding protein
MNSPPAASSHGDAESSWTGIGKTHLAIAIARSCIRSSAGGRFYNVVDLVSRLDIETETANMIAAPGGGTCMKLPTVSS